MGACKAIQHQNSASFSIDMPTSNNLGPLNFEREKEEFTIYLDEYGVLDKITDVLIMLYNEPEQPSDPIDYVRKNINADNTDVDKITEMKSLIDSAAVKLDKLLRKRDELKVQLEQMENEGCLDEEGEEELLQNDVREIDAVE